MAADTEPTALFVTCLVDQFFPSVGEASAELLERSGCRMVFPREQTCCGQPAFNMGYRHEARALARRFISIFDSYGQVVAPSGSCVTMVRVFFPELFEQEPEWLSRARGLSSRVHELSEFLSARGFHEVSDGRPGPKRKVAYHDSCHLLRELGISRQPRELLRAAPGVELVEMQGSEVCCGFGGAFSVKMADLSAAMLDDKIRAAEASGASFLTATDCGCLMHLGGALARRGSRIKALHIAEVLAGRF